MCGWVNIATFFVEGGWIYRFSLEWDPTILFEVHDLSTIKMPMQGQALMVLITFSVGSSAKLHKYSQVSTSVRLC